jgi:acyl-CoA synthetase (AMP-forming)/AMP-acid ligase II
MLIEVLRRAAAKDGDAVAMVAGGRELTYAEAVDRAESVARDLNARGISRFGIAAQDPIDVLTLLAASSAAGAEACVYPRDLDASGIAGFAARLDHDVVVADSDPGIAGVSAIAPAELGSEEGELGEAEADPVLILTTGTSGVPKGVRHTWSRLIGSVRHSDKNEGSRWLLAYNLNQFAGYQVLLHATVHGSTVVVPRSSQARDAIETMYESQVTHVSATPTFWRLLVGAIEGGSAPDIPLRQITLGGEAAPATLIERLRELFPDARIAHVYAGTEFGSVVSVGDGEAGLPMSVLERDEDADIRFRVVEGELQIKTRKGMLGYHGGDAAAEWLPTGDLVEERDGRLVFVGRTIEIINVGGAKVHPLPIEERVSSVPGVVVCAVYGKENAITGQIVAVDVVTHDDADRDAIKAAIQEACSDLPAPGRPRRVRFVDTLEVRGEKVVRAERKAEA